MVIKKRKKSIKRKITRRVRKNPHDFFELEQNLINRGWKYQHSGKVSGEFSDASSLISPDKRFNVLIFNNEAYLTMLDKKNSEYIIFEQYKLSSSEEKEIEALSDDMKKLQKTFKDLVSFLED